MSIVVALPFGLFVRSVKDEEVAESKYRTEVIYVSCVIGVFLILKHLGKMAIKFIIFPLGTSFIKHKYHQEKNFAMCKEMKNTLLKVEEVLVSTVWQSKFKQLEESSSLKAREDIHLIKKLLDYIETFLQVNLELIKGDKDKKKRAKKTSRYPIT